MKLDLKKLHARSGSRVTLSGQVGFNEDDFHEPVTLRGPLSVTGWAVCYPNHIIDLKVQLELDLERACSRCLSAIPTHVALKDQITFRGTETEQLLVDEFNYVLGEETIDLGPVLLSLVVGQLDPKPLCRPDCRGLCPACGVNLNDAPCRCEQHKHPDPRLATLAQWLGE